MHRVATLCLIVLAALSAPATRARSLCEDPEAAEDGKDEREMLVGEQEGRVERARQALREAEYGLPDPASWEAERQAAGQAWDDYRGAQDKLADYRQELDAAIETLSAGDKAKVEAELQQARAELGKQRAALEQVTRSNSRYRQVLAEIDRLERNIESDIGAGHLDQSAQRVADESFWGEAGSELKQLHQQHRDAVNAEFLHKTASTSKRVREIEGQIRALRDRVALEFRRLQEQKNERDEIEPQLGIDTIQQKQRRAEREVQRLTGLLSGKQADRGIAERDRDRLVGRIQELEAEVPALESQWREAQKRYDEARARGDALRKIYDDAAEQLALEEVFLESRREDLERFEKALEACGRPSPSPATKPSSGSWSRGPAKTVAGGARPDDPEARRRDSGSSVAANPCTSSFAWNEAAQQWRCSCDGFSYDATLQRCVVGVDRDYQVQGWIDKAIAAYEACRFQRAMWFADQVAAKVPHHPWLAANYELIIRQARRQEAAQQTLMTAKSLLDRGDLDGTLLALNRAEGQTPSGPGCSNIVQDIQGVRAAVAATRQSRDQSRRDAIGASLDTLIDMSRIISQAQGGASAGAAPSGSGTGAAGSGAGRGGRPCVIGGEDWGYIAPDSPTAHLLVFAPPTSSSQYAPDSYLVYSVPSKIVESGKTVCSSPRACLEKFVPAGMPKTVLGQYPTASEARRRARQLCPNPSAVR